jgi:hypothetical protein
MSEPATVKPLPYESVARVERAGHTIEILMRPSTAGRLHFRYVLDGHHELEHGIAASILLAWSITPKESP